MKPLIIALVLLAGRPALAQERWTEVRSKNFVVMGNASERQLRTTAVNLEQFRQAFSKLFPRAQGDSTVGTTVIVFRNDATFGPYKPRFNGRAVDTAGYFQPGTDVNFVAMAVSENAPRVVYHEYAHLLTTDSAREAPAWFREGLAEYYSTFSIDARNRNLRLGGQIREHMQQLRQNGVLSLAGLFSIDRASQAYNEGLKQGSFYATSWALVHYMLLSDGGRRQPLLLQFLDRLATGEPVLQAFQASFGMDTASMEKSLDFYIRNQVVWPTIEYSLDELPNTEVGMTARALSEAESEFYLGNLLLHTDRLQEAETKLIRSITLDPQLGGPHAAMGLLRMKQAKYEEAMDYLKRAETLDPQNYLVHYYIPWAMQAYSNQTRLRPSDEQLDVMHAQLMKAMEMAPFFVEASELLARVNLVRNEDLDQTAQVLRKALDLSPGRDSLTLMLATVLTQTAGGESPRPLLEKLVNSTSTEETIKKDARALMDYLDRPFETLESLDIVEPPAQLPRDTQDVAPVPDVQPVDLSPDNLRPRDVLEPVAPLPQLEGEKVDGLLTLLDCTDGMTMSIAAAGRTLKLHSDSPTDIRFVSYTNEVAASINCGPTTPPGIPVSVTYRPQATGDILGIPLMVEFTARQ